MTILLCEMVLHPIVGGRGRVREDWFDRYARAE